MSALTLDDHCPRCQDRSGSWPRTRMQPHMLTGQQCGKCASKAPFLSHYFGQHSRPRILRQTGALRQCRARSAYLDLFPLALQKIKNVLASNPPAVFTFLSRTFSLGAEVNFHRRPLTKTRITSEQLAGG